MRDFSHYRLGPTRPFSHTADGASIHLAGNSARATMACGRQQVGHYAGLHGDSARIPGAWILLGLPTSERL